MKAAVITLHNMCNYGSQLQTYATQEKLRQYFDDVIFIDYRRPDTYGMKFLRYFSKGNPLKAAVVLPTLLRYKQLFGAFQKQYIHLTEKTYLTEKDLDDFEDVADVYFSGSDLVWSTSLNHGVIPAYYLSFVPKGKPKYAYASSFGESELSAEEIAQTKEYIMDFTRIAVRESSGESILKEQYHYDAALQIPDPTLAFSGEDWRRLAPASMVQGDYILVYSLNHNAELDRYAVELSKKTGYKLYRLCTRYDHMMRPGRSIVLPPVFAFITLIDHAKYVLTDSFHGTAFSMNLETQPICVAPPACGERLKAFLALLGEEERLISDFQDFKILDRQVDFERVRNVLAREREKTDRFLKEITERCHADCM